MIVTDREKDEMRVAARLTIDTLREDIDLAKAGKRAFRDGVEYASEQTGPETAFPTEEPAGSGAFPVPEILPEPSVPISQ